MQSLSVAVGILAIVGAWGGGAAAAPSERTVPPVRTVDKVDLARYAGEWFEVARFPNRFQRGCAGDVRARYATRPDGRLDVANRCHGQDGRVIEAQGVARIVDPGSSAKLKVRFAPAILSFLPAVWGDYWIIGLADDYSWAVVGSPDRDYLWILSRTPALDGDRWKAAFAAARANGFDVARLVRTAQTSAHGPADTAVARPTGAQAVSRDHRR